MFRRRANQIKKEAESKAKSKTISSKPYRKRFQNYSEFREHIKSMEEKRKGPWSIKSVITQLKLEKERNKKNPNLAQFDTKFRRKELEKVMKKFNVGKKDGAIIIGAGFTGKFARAFKPRFPWQKGYKIALTDINPEYVEMAKKGKTINKKGEIIKAEKIKKSFVEDLEKPHINDTKISARVTFEATPLINSTKGVIPKNLGAKNGFIFFLTSEQVPELRKDYLKLKNKKTYGGLVVKEVKMKNGVTAVQIKVKPEYKEQYLKDRDVYESGLVKNQKKSIFYKELSHERNAVGKLNISEKEAKKRIERFKEAFR